MMDTLTCRSSGAVNVSIIRAASSVPAPVPAGSSTAHLVEAPSCILDHPASLAVCEAAHVDAWAQAHLHTHHMPTRHRRLWYPMAGLHCPDHSLHRPCSKSPPLCNCPSYELCGGASSTQQHRCTCAIALTGLTYGHVVHQAAQQQYRRAHLCQRLHLCCQPSLRGLSVSQ